MRPRAPGGPWPCGSASSAATAQLRRPRPLARPAASRAAGPSAGPWALGAAGLRLEGWVPAAVLGGHGGSPRALGALSAAALHRATAAPRGLSWDADSAAPAAPPAWPPAKPRTALAFEGVKKVAKAGPVPERPTLGSPEVSSVTADEVSHSVVIHSCASRGDARGAAAWLEEMIGSPSGANVFAFNAVTSAFASKGGASEAAAWLERMPGERLDPNVVSYTAVIDGHAKANDPRGAVDWFETMVRRRVEPNALSFNAVINSFARLGDMQGVAAWMEKMAARMSLDEISYNSALHGCARATPPRAKEAERLFRRMVASGLQPTASTLSALGRVVGATLCEELCAELGVDSEKASRHRPPPQHRRVRPSSA